MKKKVHACSKCTVLLMTFNQWVRSPGKQSTNFFFICEIVTECCLYVYEIHMCFNVASCRYHCATKVTRQGQSHSRMYDCGVLAGLLNMVWIALILYTGAQYMRGLQPYQTSWQVRLLLQSLEFVVEMRIFVEMKIENRGKIFFVWEKNWQAYFFFSMKIKVMELWMQTEGRNWFSLWIVVCWISSNLPLEGLKLHRF